MCGLIDVCYYYEWLYAQSPSGLIAVYVHDMSRSTSRLMVFHASLAPCLGVFHISCYSTSRENEDFHSNLLNFTYEYLCVTMHGLPRMSEVTLELYRNCSNNSLLSQFLGAQHQQPADNKTMPFLHAYQHQFASFSPFCK